MPSNRQIRTRKFKPEVFDPLEREGLLTGHFWSHEPSKDRQRELWETHGRDLLAFWISDPAEWLRAGNVKTFGSPPPAGLFCRPSAWWEFSAPEPRRRIERRPGPWDQDELWFGVPRFGMDQDSFETEKAFLLRHLDLLMLTEREALKAEEQPKAAPWPAELETIQ
jgi:hypothetical protein